MGLIRTTAKKMLSASAPLFGVEFLADLTGQHLISPFYHIVSDKDPIHIKHLYPVVNTSLFRKSLDFYLKHYTAISSHTLLESVTHNRQITANSFFLSFDDGFRECYDVIAPILWEKGIPATFFVNSAFVDNKELFFRLKASILIEQLNKKGISSGTRQQIVELFAARDMSFHAATDLLLITAEKKEMLDCIAPVVDVDFTAYLVDYAPYLTTQQIGGLMQKGFTIGSHSVSHPHYSSLPEDEQIAQTVDCFRFLSDTLHVTDRFFSFPHTDDGVKTAFFDNIKAEVALSFGTAGLKPDPVRSHFQRIPMETGDCNAETIIKTEYLYFLLKKVVGKHTIHRN